MSCFPLSVLFTTGTQNCGYISPLKIFIVATDIDFGIVWGQTTFLWRDSAMRIYAICFLDFRYLPRKSTYGTIHSHWRSGYLCGFVSLHESHPRTYSSIYAIILCFKKLATPLCIPVTSRVPESTTSTGTPSCPKETKLVGTMFLPRLDGLRTSPDSHAPT